MQFSRTALLLGEEGVAKLKKSRVAVFGVGGVGAIDLIDKDVVSLSNINSQIIALHSTVGRPKTEVMAERIQDINPDIRVHTHNVFYLPETAAQFDFSQYDYVVDAIDTVAGKIALIEHAKNAGVPVISSMGAGNKLDPTAFEVADIAKTSVCPLAKIMRKKMKEKGIKKLDVVWSDEEPLKAQGLGAENGRNVPGSLSFVPGAVGLIMAGHIIRKLSRFA